MMGGRWRRPSCPQRSEDRRRNRGQDPSLLLGDENS